jgi:hypothetical protein
MHRFVAACSLVALTSILGCRTADPHCGPELEYVESAGRCECINRGRFICDTPDDCYCEPPMGDGGIDDAEVPTGDATTPDGGTPCAAGELLCGTDCIDPTTDPAHCGACDDACDADYQCRASECVDPAVEVAAGPEHTCVRRASGSVWCWGSNISGQLGDGTVVDRLTPVRVVDLPPVVQITAGGVTFTTPQGNTCARTSDGAVYCWGDNEFGQIGDGTTEPRPRPVLVEGLPFASHVSISFRRGCALSTTETVVCWGDDGSGVPALPTEMRPATVGGAWASQLDLWGGGGCAAGPAGQVYCFAGSDPWQPVAGVTAEMLSTSWARCGVSAAGTVTCWGEARATGTGRTGTAEIAPEVLAGISGVRTIDAASMGYTTCVVHGGEGRVSCWGADIQETVRRGTQTFAPAPTAVAGLTNIVDVATDGNHACALRDDGVVLCWGYNSHGQLGDGTTNASIEPLVVDLP